MKRTHKTKVHAMMVAIINLIHVIGISSGVVWGRGSVDIFWNFSVVLLGQ